jgi:hypothetical protein
MYAAACFQAISRKTFCTLSCLVFFDTSEAIRIDILTGFAFIVITEQS